jgi:protein-S-isoprenylcysteine O-methyltransferase Ste14
MLWLRGIIFTVLVPCVVGAYVPHFYVEGEGLRGGWWQLGWYLVALGAVVYAVCLVDFLMAGGTPAIFFTRPLKFALGEEPPRVVRNGLYRVSRNPMYLGVVMAVFGQALIYASARIAWYGVFLFLCFYLVVVLLEEPHLRRERGESYRDYCRQVPRWLGLPR